MKEISISKTGTDWRVFSGGNGERFFNHLYFANIMFEHTINREKERLKMNLIILKDEKSFGRTGLDGEILKAQIEYNVFCAYHDLDVEVI